MTISAGWYDDGSGARRWWDGSGWTEHVANDAEAAPAPAPPSAVAEPEPFIPPYTPPVENERAGASGSSAYAEHRGYGNDRTGSPDNGQPGAAYPGAGYPGATPQTPHYPGAGFPVRGVPLAQAPPLAFPWVGLSGLVAAVIGTVLACVPVIAIVGWVLLGAGFALSLVSLFVRAKKWAGISGIGVAVVGAFIALAVGLVSSGLTDAASTDDERPGDGSAETTVEGETIDILDLDLGDCLPYLDGEEDLYEVTLVPCEQPHDSEVYFVFSMPEDAGFPGNDALTDEAISRCETAFEEFVGMSYEESELDYWWFVPTKATWNYNDDRAVQCLIFSYDGDVEGSLEGAAR